MTTITIRKINGTRRAEVPILEEVDRMMQEVERKAFDLFLAHGASTGHHLEHWLQAERCVLGAPPAEMAEDEKEYRLRVALPGFEPLDVEVTATPQEVVISAEAKASETNEKIDWTELRQKVTRRFQLACPIDVEKTKASLDKGLLCIVAQKAPQVEQKRVQVASATACGGVTRKHDSGCGVQHFRRYCRGAPVTVVPLDISQQTLVSRERLGLLANNIFAILDRYTGFSREQRGHHAGPLHDPNVIVWIARPELYRGLQGAVRVGA